MARVNTTSDAMFLPGALKYGGFGGLAALSAPAQLIVAGTEGISAAELQPLISVYEAAKGKLTLQRNGLTAGQVVEMLLQ